MSRFILPLILFGLLVLEGTLIQLFIPERFQADFIMVPRFIAVMLVFIGIFLGKSSALLYGIGFGLLYDVVYTNILGVYAFGFGLLGYSFALTYKWLQYSNVTQAGLAIFAVALLEYYQYGLFLIIGITEMEGMRFFQERLLPTLALNGAFAILTVYPMRRLLQYVKRMASLREK
ncbi:rod shape-determining protein MreD [Halalkalibacterium ligniniphilum]|uniref:rod shape-determining protein MreD n=1 Tax=Halalkalibacterium ligniniphilum TaxID=1134413 RepID=UPI00034D4575|nr:rod shape-determining protein MreD [Halalkalibacterium ligniniphilum]